MKSLVRKSNLANMGRQTNAKEMDFMQELTDFTHGPK